MARYSGLLLNLFYNLIGYRSKRQMLIVFICIYAAIGTYFTNKRKLKELQQLKKIKIKIKDAPLITFTGGGVLGFYYQGICAYLRDNFDLEDVRFAGISAGSTAAASLAARLPTEASMIFGLKWFNIVCQRKLKGFLLPPSKFCSVGQDICEQFGITDQYIRSFNGKTDYYYGVTNCSVWPPKHELVGSFNDIHESFYAMSCSCRVLPFFTAPGYYKDMWLLDGGFTAMFSIPKDANPDKIIKISPSSRINADIQPDCFSEYHWNWIDAVKMPSLEQIYQQFKRGYNDAIRCRPKLIAKGLKLKSIEKGGGNHNKLEQHMKMLRGHGNHIFYDIDGLRKQDFSHFMMNQDISSQQMK